MKKRVIWFTVPTFIVLLPVALLFPNAWYGRIAFQICGWEVFGVLTFILFKVVKVGIVIKEYHDQEGKYAHVIAKVAGDRVQGRQAVARFCSVCGRGRRTLFNSRTYQVHKTEAATIDHTSQQLQDNGAEGS